MSFKNGIISLLTLLAVVNVANGSISTSVTIDGSSTVFPITEAIAEEFHAVNPDIKVTIGVSGTGGGFKKFIAKEIDINNASRPIKDSEAKAAKESSVNYVQIPVAYDGITIVINKKNSWATTMTTAELKLLWDSGSSVKTWKQIRPSWPDKEIKLYGPGTDSGTFDYFTEEINGKSGQCRSDFSKSEDDNVLVTGVTGDEYALGFFGYAYYKENMTKLTAVKIDGGKGAIEPTEKTINDGTYAPLSRQIFIYVNTASYKEKNMVEKFVKFYLDKVPSIAKDVGYVPLAKDSYKKSIESLIKL